MNFSEALYHLKNGQKITIGQNTWHLELSDATETPTILWGVLGAKMTWNPWPEELLSNEWRVVQSDVDNAGITGTNIFSV